MRILHVNKFFDLAGGAEVYMHGLMEAQKKAGHDVHALSTRSPKNVPSPDASRFVTRYDLRASREEPSSDGLLTDAKKAINFVWNREAECAMRQALDELKPDVVHLHNIYHHLSTSILSPIRRSGIACVQTLHDLKLACPNYKMYTEGALCERCKGGHYFEAVKHRCLFASFLPNMLAAVEMGFTKARQEYERTVHTFICPSHFMAEKMIDWGEPASKFTVVLPPMRPPAEVSVGQGGYLLAVGRLSPEKGYDQLLRAAARVPLVPIKIAGSGPEEDRLRSFVRAHALRHVEFVGHKRGLDLERLYREARGYVSCPVGYENAPLSVLDALGYGLPVLAARIGGLPEMVEDGANGFLIEMGNVDAWTATLRRFGALSDIEWTAFARRSREMATQKYPDWPGHVERIEAVYRSAMG